MTVIGIGTDIVECLRIVQMIERHGELFLTRVFTLPRDRVLQLAEGGHATLCRSLGCQGGDSQGVRHRLVTRDSLV